MKTTVTEQWFKNGKISQIVELAEQIYGRERVSNLIQYTYDELNRWSPEELDGILSDHKRELDELCKPIIISADKAKKYDDEFSREFNDSLSITSIRLG